MLKIQYKTTLNSTFVDTNFIKIEQEFALE